MGLTAFNSRSVCLDWGEWALAVPLTEALV